MIIITIFQNNNVFHLSGILVTIFQLVHSPFLSATVNLQKAKQNLSFCLRVVDRMIFRLYEKRM